MCKTHWFHPTIIWHLCTRQWLILPKLYIPFPRYCHKKFRNCHLFNTVLTYHLPYLGSLISQDGRCDKEIKHRIGISKNMEKVLTSRAISMSMKLHLLKCYVWSTLLYGCESWTVSQRMKSQLKATEMWFLRRMLRIAWTDKVSN